MSGAASSLASKLVLANENGIGPNWLNTEHLKELVRSQKLAELPKRPLPGVPHGALASLAGRKGNSKVYQPESDLSFETVIDIAAQAAARNAIRREGGGTIGEALESSRPPPAVFEAHSAANYVQEESWEVASVASEVSQNELGWGVTEWL